MSDISLFFDLDGTLMNSASGIIASYKHTLKELGFDTPTDEDLHALVGPPLHIVFPILLGENAPLEEAIALYREYYQEEGIFDAEPYDGLEEMFDALYRIETKIYIATSKPQYFADKIAAQFGLDRYIDVLFGSELSGERSDKTELLQFALDETGANPLECAMIGDRLFDVNGARNNDILSIGALWGYGGVEELRQAEADALAASPEEIPPLIIDLFEREI